MSRYRAALPQLGDQMFVTDGGLETTLIFDQGHELPEFAAFDLYRQGSGEQVFAAYLHDYIETARRHGAGFILESVTWRANPDWATKIGYDAAQLEAANRHAVADLIAIRDRYDSSETPYVISGCVGPRGDGYTASSRMTTNEAASYHDLQIGVFADTEADLVTAMTLNYVEEAHGVIRAAERHGMPVAISFTVETDGQLPSGQPLGEAIEQLDHETHGYASYYMINCAHPSHFTHRLHAEQSWTSRIGAVRCNASTKSHAELDESTELDLGDPAAFGAAHVDLKRLLPNVTVFGGCCGTNHQHVAEVATACAPLFD